MVGITDLINAIEQSTGASLGTLGAAFQESTTPFKTAQEQQLKVDEAARKKDEDARKQRSRQVLSGFFSEIQRRKSAGETLPDFNIENIMDFLGPEAEFEDVIKAAKGTELFADIEAKAH